MDILQQGSDWLQAQRQAYMSQPITYSRGGDQIVVNATVGKTDYEVEDNYGLSVKAEMVDFLIATEDLSLAGEKTLPRPGDLIRFERSESTVVFEVMTLAGQGHFRYSDSFGKTLRIHTKEISME